MLQRLPITLTQWKESNSSENLLNEICQIVYSLCQAKKLLKKVYNNIMNLIKLWNRMDTIFMNSENSKTSDPYRLLLNLSGKIVLKRKNRFVALSNLDIYYTWTLVCFFIHMLAFDFLEEGLGIVSSPILCMIFQ